ncbi:LysM peptidoglycan-binding domain-containing protein [Sphingomonas sp. Leaf67]|uniref:LysM peptidoglycan-binding domain-containing protein n=1 Tax=Sphingomonas sp. Leaf67 TaxID=1736230 RepID=UPI00070025B5|nr:LysM peptidoglycan-binding domain-containing protein [Sphingomonas sp. Leaf67]
MVAIFTGAGTGFERGSGNVLGGAGTLGQAALGRSGEQLLLNAANGNLMLMQQDELLLGRGPDAAISRTYNSQGDLSDENGDNWRQSTDRSLYGLTGTVNTFGSTVKRASADGSVFTYVWNGTAYRTTDGAGAHDTITYSTADGWKWTDGDSQVVETYGYNYRNHSYISEQRDPSGNALTFAYADGKLTDLRTANGERIQYGYSGNAITDIRTFTMQGGVERMQTRTRYAYDSLGRLGNATVDLTPADNSVADGKSYGSAYTYIGDTRLIASVAQTDGTRVDFEYDKYRRVTAVTQTVDGSATRVTRLSYNADNTTIIDPAGQMTRLDFAGGDFALAGGTWDSGNLTRQADTINGAAATRYMVQTGGQWAGISQGFPVTAGETMTFGISLKAVGDITTQNLGLYSDQTGWGVPGISVARIVSGPGTIEHINGGFWRVVGLSPTEGTRVEITRTYDKTGSGGAYFYVDEGSNYRAGTSLIAGGQTLVRSTDASSLDRMNATKWTASNLNRATEPAINGAAAYKFTVKTASTAANLQRTFTAKAGETYSFLITLKATGFDQGHHLGLGGSTSAWGPDDLSSARVLSGPGAVDPLSGGFYSVRGLSATEATTILVTRTYARDDSAYARLFVALGADEPAGAGVIVAGVNLIGPVDEPETSRLLTKITVPATEAGAAQQITQFSYSSTGNVATVTDPSGGITRMAYDAAGNLLTTTDRLGNVVTRTYDAKNQLLRTSASAVSAGAAETVASNNVYDSANRLRYTVSAERRVTRYTYTANGLLIRTDSFTADIPSTSVAMTEAALNSWVSGLSAKSARMIVRYEYDARGEVSRIVRDGAADASGEPLTTQGYTETVFVRDASGRLLERVTGGQRELFVYDGLGRMIGSTDVRGGQTSIAFNDAGAQTVVTLASGAVQTSTYNRAGDLVSVSEAGSYSGTGTTGYRYDRTGRVRIATDSFGQNRYVVYDRTGRKTGEVDPLGQLTEYRYDQNDRLVATVGWSTALSAEQMARLADPAVDIDVATIRPAAGAADRWDWIVYDREGRVLQRIDATGASVIYDFDASGRLLRETGYANRVAVDALKTTLPTTVTRPTADAARDSVSRTFYDRDGNVIGALDGEGYLSRSTYDAAGNRVSATSFAKRVTDTLRTSASFTALLSDVGTNPNDRTVRYVYDGQGLLRFTVDTVQRVTEYVYAGARAGDATGKVRQTIVYARPIAPLASYSMATVVQGLATVGATDDPANRRSFAVYDDRGNLTFAIDAAGSVTGYGYDGSGNVVKTTRFVASYATTTLPTHETMAAWATANGGHGDTRVTRSYYAARGELRFTVDPMGYVSRYDYDAGGRVVAVVRFDTAMAGATDATTIASVAAWQTGTSVVTTTSYDAAGRVFETTDAAGTVTRYIYNVNGTVQSTTKAYGTVDQVRTQLGYDAAGRVVTRIADADGLQSTTRYTYDGFGNLLTQVAPDGTSTTSFAYDREGRMLTRTNALGQVQAYDYDSFGQRVRIVDERGGATYSYYDAAGRVVAVRDAENYVTETSYTAFDQIATVTRRKQRAGSAAAIGTLPTVAADAKDAVTQFVYDKLGRVVRTIDAEGFSENNRYNSFGEVVQATNKLGGVTFRFYDRRGQVFSENVAKTASDATGFARAKTAKISEFDPVYYANTYDDLAGIANDPIALRAHWQNSGWREGRNPNADFDTRYYLASNPDVAAAGINPLEHYANYGAGEGRAPNTQLVAGAQEAGGVVTHYEYDARGNRTRMIEAWSLTEQRTTDYSYDALDRLIEKRGMAVDYGVPGSSTNAGTAQPTEKYLYDRHGNLTRRTDAQGRHSWFYYDALDRKNGEVDAAGAYVTYAYDKNGGLIRSRAYATAVTTSQLTTETRPAATGDYRETTYANDVLGRRLSSSMANIRTGAWDAAIGTYVYGFGTVTQSVTYDAAGNAVRSTDATGASILSYYDALGRKTAQVDQEGFLTEWTLDAEGNALAERRYAVAVTDATEASRPQGTVNADDRVTEFSYDRNGRRLTETRKDVAAWSVDPTTGALTDVSGDARITYSYNGLGLVTSKREATGDTTLYTYDRIGRLIGEQRPNLINSTTDEAIPQVTYYYDGNDNLVRTVEGVVGSTDRVTTNRYDAVGRKVAMTDAMGSTRFYFYDRVGNMVAEAYSRRNSAGSVLREGAIYRYDNVGRLRGQISATNWTQSSAGFTSLTTAGAPPETTFSYNVFGELVSRSIGNSVQEQHEYDDAGRAWRSTGGDGTWRYFLYDGAGRQTLTLASDGSANIQNLSLGNVLRISTLDGRALGDPANGVVATATQYDARGQVARVHSLQRELASGVTGGADLRTSRSYTAFGEVASETDARGATTYYGYNRMGRVTSIARPVVLGADIDGTGIFEYRYYDLSGRLAGAKDGNGNIATRRLAGGTGYGGAAELVTAEYHADGGRVFQRYDDAGNLVKRTDELGRATYMSYDKLGRLLNTSNVDSRDIAHSYTYDSLGRRLTHSQTGRATTDRETTDYDVAGRVTTSRAFGGEVTTNAYAWDSTINSGLGVTGGWRQTTTFSNSKQTIESKDTFGRLTSRTDMGGNVATTSYDQAGRVATIIGLETQTFAWLNTGLLATQTSDMGSGTVRSVATFGYDQVGNRLTETFTRDNVVYRRSEAIFDMQNRMRSWADTSDALPAASMGWAYDRNGNILQTIATRATLNQFGGVASTKTEERWFRYDAMNRVTLDGGRMGASGIERGSGTEITYRVDGSRAMALTSFTGYAFVRDPNYGGGNDPRAIRAAALPGGDRIIRVAYAAERRETYSWRNDGQVSTVLSEQTGYYENEDGTVTPDEIFTMVGAAGYEYDVLGRLTRQTDRRGGNEAVYDRIVTYDGSGRGQIVAETTVTKQGTDTINTRTSTDYGTGTDYALGAVKKVTATTTVNGGSSTTTTTTNSYEWRDAAQLTGTVTTKTNANTAYTSYTYSGVGQLDMVSIGGDRSRTVTFVNDLAGQVIKRDEADSNATTGDPHEIWYRHGGREMGYVGNNGSASDSYFESIGRRATKPSETSTFSPLGGQSHGSDFAETIDRINSYETGSAGRSYTVQAGDTLSGIADQVWGDASLWYKLATANGLGADSALVAGQVLTIPAGVVRSTYNADTYRPYDPTDVLGDLNPNPKAKSNNKCGGFGKILLVAVAVAATIFTSGAAIAALSGSVGSVMQGVGTLLALKGAATVGVSTLIAAGVAGGAVGSAVSQGVGLTLGIQDKFSWAGVAMAGLSGGVGAGLAAAPLGSGILGATTRGLLGNVITQGVAMATDQQKRFDWVGLGVAGVSAAVGQGIAGNSKSFWAQTGAGAASSLAGAATRSIVTQTSFGDNILAVLPDVIGSTVGRITARGVALTSLSPNSSVSGTMGPYTGLQELISRYPGGGDLVNAGYQTPPSPVAEEPEIVVIGRRLADEAAKAGRGILDRIDRFFDTNLFGHNSHKNTENSRSIITRFYESNFFRPSSDEEIARVVRGKSPDAPFNASQPEVVRSWVLQRRLFDGVAGFVNSNFGRGSVFDRYVGTPTAQGLAFTNRYVVGPGTPVDTLVNKPFYSAMDAVAATPLGDPGVIMSLESSGAFAAVGAFGSGVRSISIARAEAAGTIVPKVGIQANRAAGDAVRDLIAAREAPSIVEQSFTTVGGVRRVDVLKLGDETLAIESKVGRTSLGSRERQELARDWWLQRQGQVGGVRWEFTPSGVNGGIGPSPALQRMLDKLGFQTRINP